MGFNSVLIFLVALTNISAAKMKLGSLIPICSRSDHKFAECVKMSSQQMIAHMADGIRDFKLVPTDPLKVPFMDLSQAEKTLGMKLNISDTTHTGISKVQIKDVRFNLEKKHVELDLFFPRYSITGTCTVGGKILLLPISGHGYCNLTASDMNSRLIIDGHLQPKKGRDYYTPDNIKLKIINAKGNFELTGLFGGNKALGDTMNRFLTENSQEVLNEMKGTLEDVWSGLFGGIVGRIFASVPYDELTKP